MTRRQPSRLARFRYRVLWAALGEPGREFVVRHVLEQVADAELEAKQRAARAAALADPLVTGVLADLLETEPEAGRRMADRLGIPIVVVTEPGPPADYPTPCEGEPQ
jgi:hypothetical protein